MTDAIDETRAAVRTTAQGHCPRCGSGRMGGIVAKMAADAGVPHTCQEDIAAADRYALAVLGRVHDAVCPWKLLGEPVHHLDTCGEPDWIEARARLEASHD